MENNHLQNLKDKIVPLSEVKEFIQTWKEMGMTVGFTNGCFDLIHKGHLTYLAKAANEVDILVLGLNSDVSVKRIKGDARPVKDEETRAMVLASMEFIEGVFIFDDETPYELIKKVKPNILFKGGDYDADCTDENDPKYIVGSDIVKSKGGKVMTIPFVDGHSTTKLIEKSNS